jgi:hypothetical protein
MAENAWAVLLVSTQKEGHLRQGHSADGRAEHGSLCLRGWHIMPSQTINMHFSTIPERGNEATSHEMHGVMDRRNLRSENTAAAGERMHIVTTQPEATWAKLA